MITNPAAAEIVIPIAHRINVFREDVLPNRAFDTVFRTTGDTIWPRQLALDTIPAAIAAAEAGTALEASTIEVGMKQPCEKPQRKEPMPSRGRFCGNSTRSTAPRAKDSIATDIVAFLVTFDTAPSSSPMTICATEKIDVNVPATVALLAKLPSMCIEILVV